MAELTPLYMDISGVYSGDELGLPYRDIMGEGVVGAGDLAVTQHAGAANLSVDVAAGAAWVLGDTDTNAQPCYRVRNDAVVNKGITPDPSNPRKVIIVAQITDATFSGASRAWAITAIHGAPNAAPVEPTLPASALKLAVITVPAGATSIVTANIADARVQAAVGAGQARVNGPTTYRKNSLKAVVNTAAETDLLNGEITIAANALGANGLIRLKAWGDWLNNTGAARALPVFKLKLGSTVIFQTPSMAGFWSPGGARLGWTLEATIQNAGAANVQSAALLMKATMGNGVGNGLSTFSVGQGATWLIGGLSGFGSYEAIATDPSSFLAVDTTVAQLLGFTATNALADPNYDVRLAGALVEVI